MDLEVEARRLQQIGLNAYESRAYLMLIGHPRFKALEVAGRARIPRQKIYEVLDSLIEKGFVRFVQGKAKEFSAVDPRIVFQTFLARKRESFEKEWQGRRDLAGSLATQLAEVFVDGNQDRGPLDYLRIVSDTGQIAEEFRRLLLQSEKEYLEFARPPYAVQPTREPLIQQLIDKGVECRLLFDSRTVDQADQDRLKLVSEAGAQVRLAAELPLKLAVFDSRSGMISLDDPIASHPQITALVFEHHSLADAMGRLFYDLWERAEPIEM